MNKRSFSGFTFVEIMVTLALIGLIIAMVHNFFFSGIKFVSKSGASVESFGEHAKIIDIIKRLFLSASHAPEERWSLVDPANPPEAGDHGISEKLFSFIDDPPTMVFFSRNKGLLSRVSVRFFKNKGFFEILDSQGTKRIFKTQYILDFNVIPIDIKIDQKIIKGAEFRFLDSSSSKILIRVFPIQFNNESVDRG